MCGCGDGMITLTPKKIPSHLQTYNRLRVAEGLSPITEEQALREWSLGHPYKYGVKNLPRHKKEPVVEVEDPVITALRNSK